MHTDRRIVLCSLLVALSTVAVAVACRDEKTAVPTAVPNAANVDQLPFVDAPGGDHAEATTLYVWAGDQARRAPDFLAVIDFDRRSKDYGKVLRTVPIPPPGNVGNEPHHCHTSVDQRILACGGLLSVLKGQNDIFFFDITNARDPRFLRSTHAPNSSITDDFLPLPNGGFLVTNMGSASGGGWSCESTANGSVAKGRRSRTMYVAAPRRDRSQVETPCAKAYPASRTI